MNDEKLKLILAGLAGLIFSLIFVLLAFVLPLENHSINTKDQAKDTLEKISKGIREGQQHNPPLSERH
ncbi:MAG: hypothetical protein NTY39_08150 [Campylobacterales bacterium]|nr:hypothetical protein [Campylobacterales bacterium]